jgi:hypothetical protein
MLIAHCWAGIFSCCCSKLSQDNPDQTEYKLIVSEDERGALRERLEMRLQAFDASRYSDKELKVHQYSLKLLKQLVEAPQEVQRMSSFSQQGPPLINLNMASSLRRRTWIRQFMWNKDEIDKSKSDIALVNRITRLYFPNEDKPKRSDKRSMVVCQD